MKFYAQYEIIDISGKLIKKGKLGFENATLNVQFLSTGTYVLKIQTSTKQAIVKFIKE
ncbi:MAG: T9SS type A sorting domain-containing protein [Flavobacteriales bacterium]